MSTRSQRLRIHRIERLVASAFKVTPVAHVVELGDYGEVTPPEAFRVRCGECKVTWRFNQGHYIRTHYENHHGWTWKQAWDAWWA